MVASQSSKVPEHIAIIMDGNGRWAQAHGLARTDGHAKGADSVRATVRACRSAGVKYLTLYAFSVANWRRPATEVRALMQLLAHFAEREKFELKERGIRLEVIGDISELPVAARRAIDNAMAYTADCNDMVLSLALSYGGRQDIVTAARALAIKVRAGLLLPEEIDEQRLQSEMTTHRLPAVDLLIRTGGESRVSDFLLFESAYAELLFLPIMWPEFGEEQLNLALAQFGQRERRFGLTSSQVRGGDGKGFDPLDSVPPAEIAASGV
ncbi:MAG TPA: polyprenyl diphosphate synthase [Polyangiaceae bacterium]|jgi:undecaprenyl diphosphate synthase|nr:polyprenyl diphosphate synthase [Polyangiaceae bacterium]